MSDRIGRARVLRAGEDRDEWVRETTIDLWSWFVERGERELDFSELAIVATLRCPPGAETWHRVMAITVGKRVIGYTDSNEMLFNWKAGIRIEKKNGTFVVGHDYGNEAIGRGRTMQAALADWVISNQANLGIAITVDKTAKPAEMARRRRELSRR